ncbi:hypothetical protein [uncultured Mailhella sp.]
MNADARKTEALSAPSRDVAGKNRHAAAAAFLSNVETRQNRRNNALRDS